MALNNGKAVTFKFAPIAVVTPSNCSGWGYNYDYRIQYTATVTGGPVTFWNVGATFQSGTGENFSFNMDNASVAAGAGVFTTNNNQGRYANDCATATATSLNIRNLVVTVGTSDGNATTPCAFSSSITATPLSVKLISFDAAIVNGQVAINWVTGTETNNAYFILERSADAQSWDALTQMDGAGTTHYSTTYNYNDELPAAGMNYYRLKQVDDNGTATYSKIIAVKAIAHLENSISLYPNPAMGNELHFNGLQQGEDYSIEVMNSSSATVFKATQAGNAITLPSVNAGLYFVHIWNNKTGAGQVIKLVKQ